MALTKHERKIAALRQALIAGESSGEADELDMMKIKATARQWRGDKKATSFSRSL